MGVLARAAGTAASAAPDIRELCEPDAQVAEVTALGVAVDQLHVGPTDDTIEHVMSAFCPCFPALDVEETATDVGDDTVQVITYRHNQVGDAS